MRRVLFSLAGVALATAIAASTLSARGVIEPASRAIYDSDPEHLWNRLHEALFVRTGPDGADYGRDRLEPLLWRTSKHLLQGASHRRLLTVLDEFLRTDGATQIADPLKRAMLQRDVWLVFSWLESGHDNFYGSGPTPYLWDAAQDRLRAPLARVIGRLALTAAEIARLPDTYALAVASRAFPAADNAAAPSRAFLPADLFARNSPWVSIGREGTLAAPMHVLQDNPFTTSAFLVFLSLPGGRNATLAYVERLKTFDRPLLVKASEDDEGRGVPYVPNPALPAFPAGTRVALVRRALLVDTAGTIVPTALTENVQVRVYRTVAPATREAFEDGMRIDPVFVAQFHATQSSNEFVLSRARLFSERAGGLQAVGRDEEDFRTGFSTPGVDVFELGRSPAEWAAAKRQARPLDTCQSCHSYPGIYSVNTFFPYRFTSFTRPPIAPPTRFAAVPVADAVAATVKWKESRADWLTLKRLLND